MANIIGIVDPRFERRNKFINAAAPRLKIFPWLQCNAVQDDKIAIAWAAHPSAPVSRIAKGDHVSGLILGSIESSGDRQDSNVDSTYFLRAPEGAASLSGQSGFYMACAWDSYNTVTLGTDILGLFPLYYFSTDTILLFSTMYSLFRDFPDFSATLNPRGLAGILLTMHITGNQTLYKNVRRLSFGHILRWKSGEGSREVPIEKLKPASTYFNQPYKDNLDTFHQLLHKALSKSSVRDKTLLLSGGIDSRLLAGYLSTSPISGPSTISIGEDSDNEMRFAARVSKTIGWPQHRIRVDYSRFAEFARMLVETEQISNGFADLAFFQACEQFNALAPSMITGFAGDIVMGGSHVRAGYDKTRQAHTFEAKFRIINRYGLSPERIKQLVHPDLINTAVDEAMEELREVYNSIDGEPFQRTWMFDMIHRVRFHTAASIVWRLSFGSWPVMPYISREILVTAFGMPEDTLRDRRIQIDLLCQHFPSLASLPIERLTLDTAPLIMPFYRRYLSSLMRVSNFQDRKYQIMKLLKLPNYESRFYHRTFDINNKGWESVRKDAEQYRGKAEKIFRPDTLKELLPPPNIPIHVPEATVDSSSRKLLLAFMLWAGENV